MKAKDRRNEIINRLEQENSPVSASRLAEQFSVSRQIIVGDVALLRAEDHKIVATSRGYILESKLSEPGYTGRLVCSHTPEQTRQELYTIVDYGGKIVDVGVEHEIYGELLGMLNLSSRLEVDEFIQRYEDGSAKLLTELTGGVHTHGVLCKNKEVFLQIKKKLEEQGFLYDETK